MALRVIISLIATCLLLARPATAQESVKRALFEDCDRAAQEFATLTVEQQTSLAEFFARVVALSTQSPSAPEAFAAAPGMPAGTDTSGLVVPKSPELVTGALWQSLDAKRELKAKRCALELLRSAGGLALNVLPTLAQTYAQQPLSDEIAVGLEETVADIAERAHKQGMSPSPEACTSLAGSLFTDRSLVARSVVQEFLQPCLPHILTTLPSPETRASEVTTFLKDVDPTGALVMRTTLDAVTALPADKMSLIVPLVPLPDNSQLTPFVNDFIRLAADPIQSTTFLPLLGQACVSLRGFAIDASQQTIVTTIPGLLSPTLLSPAQAGCLLTASPSAAKRLPALLSRDATPEQQRHVLAIMRAAYQGIPNDTRSELCSRARERALELQPETTEAALTSLAHCTEPRGENASMAYSLLKSIDTLQSTPARRDAIFSLTVDLLQTTGLGKDRTRFGQLLKPSLQTSIPTQGALYLATQIPDLLSDVVKRALEVPPSPGSIAALKALLATKTIPKRSTQSLVDLLRYPEMQSLGEETLVSLGSGAIAPLRRAASRPSWGGRPSALSALIGLQAATKGEVADFAATLSTQEGCSFVSAHSQTICLLVKKHPNDQTLRGHLSSAVQRCINEMNSEQLSPLTECDADLVLGAADALTSSLITEGDRKQLTPIVGMLARDSTTTPAHTKLITSFLERGSQTSLITLLQHVASQPAAPPEVLQGVRRVAERNRDTGEVFLAALQVLAHHGDTSYDWAAVVREAIQSCGSGQIPRELLAIVGQIPSEVVLAQVIPALESDNPEKLVGGALVGAALGPKAIPIVSRLWHLREARPPLVRAMAILALLQINPLTPDMQDEVSRILVNRFFPVASQLPIKWAETVAVVDMDRSSFGDLRKARLARLLHSTR
jgi:hypothetical protein